MRSIVHSIIQWIEKKKYIYSEAHINARLCTCVCMYIFVYLYVCVSACLHVCVSTYVCVAYALGIWFVQSLKLNVATDARSIWVKV